MSLLLCLTKIKQPQKQVYPQMPSQPHLLTLNKADIMAPAIKHFALYPALASCLLPIQLSECTVHFMRSRFVLRNTS